MKNWSLVAVGALAAVAPIGVANAVEWKKSTAGTFDWADTNNWNGAALPGASDEAKFDIQSSGDQMVLVTNNQNVGSFFFKTWGANRGTTTFNGKGTGVLTVANEATDTTFDMRLGPLVFDALKVRANVAATRLGYGGDGYYSTLTLTNGASFSVDGTFNLGEYNSGAGGRMIMGPGTTYIGSGGTYIGYTRPGALWMDGGSMKMTSRFTVGHRSEGYCRVNDGELVVQNYDETEQMRLGYSGDGSANNGAFQMHVAGGRVAVTGGKAESVNSAKVFLGSNGRQYADLYCEGGHFDIPTCILELGHVASRGNQRSTLTLDGTGRLTSYLVAIKGQGCTGSGRTVINLNGDGMLILTRGFADYGNTTVVPTINFNGGTLAFDTRYSYNPAWGDIGTDQIIYPNGGAIKYDGYSATVSAKYRPAGGWGVKSIAVATPGSAYNAPPRVTISGGSGSNATAIAILASDRTVERFVVTCPGEGYAENDELTVTLTDGWYTGSGATAGAVTLAENTLPTMRKRGTGNLVQKAASDWTGRWKVEAGELQLRNGDSSVGSFAKADKVIMANATLIKAECDSTVGNVKSHAVRALEVEGGAIEAKSISSNGTIPNGSSACGEAELALGSFSRSNGGVLFVTTTNKFSVSLASTELAASAANGGVVNGIVYTQTDEGLGYPNTRPLTIGGDGKLVQPTYDTSATPAAGANWAPTKSGTYSGITSLGSVLLSKSDRSAIVVIDSSSTINVASGMVILQRPQNHEASFRVTGGGAITTDNPGGFVFTGPCYQNNGRTHSQYPNDDYAHYIYGDTWPHSFRVGPIVDPVGGSALSVTVAGSKKTTPETGMIVNLEEDAANTFSGGIYLVNGGLVVKADQNLGATGSGIDVYGSSSIATSLNSALAIAASRTITLNEGSTLLFSPAANGSDIAATLEGSGELLTADYGWSGKQSWGVTYSGNHDGFTGTYWIHGITRMQNPSANAAIRLADATNGVGTIEMAGSFTRAPGTNANEVCWARHATMPDCGARGGFGATGGALTVNLGGDARTLVAGSDCLPEGAVIALNSDLSTGDLTWCNPIDLNGKTQRIAIGKGGSVTLTGGIVDSVGGGKLDIDGDVNFENFTWQLDPEAVKTGEEIELGHINGEMSGTITTSPVVPGWCIRSRNGVIKFTQEVAGLLIIVR